ncbi:MMPL family transporter [Ponticaulis sp.]|uniref:efflux RND transporter permease subunit n=1 Tax=Ponticaulis sp. TaxID=2020902 RepID=UPI000B689807|nr:MMPL family transporter [Ponticaulis sp.]MAI91232.1 RND transporter [Ponticaulis sp.]OUX98544.1 MAG: RND transporter [Hyphomonadaceae bacterium TMED5]|tara:strand:- start:49250 stop:51649 length:2400 start_codon:yes stop_codon:yes gene_type:complete
MAVGTSGVDHPVIRNVEDFDTNSGGWMEKVLFNNRIVFLIICALITAVFAFQARNVTMNAAFEKMIPTSHPYIVNFLDNQSDLAGGGNTLRIAVAVDEGTIFEKEYLQTVRELTDAVFLLPGVDRPYLESLWAPAVRWTAVTEDGLDGGPVIPDNYDGSPESIEQVQVNVERSGEIGQLVAANYRSSIIVVPLQSVNAETGERINYAELSRTLEDLRAQYETENISIHITGFSKIVGDMIAGLKQMLMFFAIAILISAGVLYWYTRCVRSTLLVIACSLVAVIWLMGFLPTFGYELDPYSILVPFLVFAIGMSHGAQKMNGIMQDIGRGAHKLVAARYTFRRLFLAGLTALLADAVGFAVLMVIDIPVIQDLAITASIGVAMLIITNLLLLPVLLSYSGVNAKVAHDALGEEIEDAFDTEHEKHPLWDFLDKFTQKKWATYAIAVSAVMLVGGFMYAQNLKIGDTNPGAPELRPNSRYNVDNAYMVENYAASSDVYVVMVTTPQYACAHYNTIMAVDALENRLQQLPGVESTNSIAGLARLNHAGLNEGSLDWYEIPRSQFMLNAIITRAPRELFNQNCDLLTIYAYLTDHKADTLESVVATVEEFADEYNTEDICFLNAAGNAGIEAATNIVVEHANKIMLLLVYAAVIILAFITFRSWRAVICAIVPLIMTSVLCEALMVSLNIGVKVATLPVVALGVGIGVDYSLYVMTVMLSNLRQGRSLSASYYEALTFTGKVVILTGISLGIAVATWAFSPIKFQADMGILLAFMFIWNMLGALILLPALSYFLLKPAKVEVE